MEIKKFLIGKKVPLQLTNEEQQLVCEIREKTAEWNLNNVTRTRAYLDYYKSHPEIHWAFLAHMVSRNGGWNMTDLRGEFLERLMSEKERVTFFTFLERANWLIFQDAYPQLLLYEHSLNKQKNLFHLLPHLGVSVFMEAVWNYTWDYPDSAILTASLIVNEQNYIEKRLIHSDSFSNISDSLAFMMQDVLSLNHVIFPTYEQLLGMTVHHFENLNERINIGKKLYLLLFENVGVLNRVYKWAIDHPHTGSRKDYSPHLFNSVKELLPFSYYLPRLHECQIRTGAARFYSPMLEFAWKNQKHSDAESGDWYVDWRVVHLLKKCEDKIDGNIQSDYCKTLHQLELATLAKKAIGLLA
ncbi:MULTISPECIES: DUF2515 family protein [unclassified Bacillus (in: firmicutes)]|uniref:DUF2515 family protein n=1 Tax=unclassified Bacillus (in: firmicutes) TaxID=185979 RepID=UPI0008F2FC01|nr:MULTISPECIES: DUF2515 family protein [unclassified Bacillus (in: firmicutes)]SFA86780.1 Protein of unknown function [Bacillus sp. UNCCL13]SFQ83871.1 Protein of unknown function [Bacillus sp. cl95]